MLDIKKKKKIADQVSKWVITLVGVGTLGSMVAILVVIFAETVPLFKGSSFDEVAKFKYKIEQFDNKVMAVGSDVYFDTSYVLLDDGKLHLHLVDTGEFKREHQLRKGDFKILKAQYEPDSRLTILWSDYKLVRYDVQFKPIYDVDQERQIRAQVKEAGAVSLASGSYQDLLSRSSEDQVLFAALLDDGRVLVHQLVQEESFLGDAELKTFESTIQLDKVKGLKVAVNWAGTLLYLYGDDQKVYVYDLSEPGELALKDKLHLDLVNEEITAMAVMQGDYELVTAFMGGKVKVFSQMNDNETGKKVLKQTHQFETGKKIKSLFPSARDRTILVKTKDGIQAWFTTHEGKLATYAAQNITHYSLSKRGKGITMINKDKEFIGVSFNGPHPEFSLSTLFSKVWYAGYDKPEYVWQSSSGSDDFEPKFSLIPLIFGTLKGAFYAMFFSVPIAILAAIYTSQFAGSKGKEIIKPIVELMAAVPSVVVGFLAALWLAPLVDDNLLLIFMIVILTPSLILLSFLYFKWKGTSAGYPTAISGKEFYILVPIAFIAFELLFLLSSYFNLSLFDGKFSLWWTGHMNHYDMRNSVIISIALGITVIPIIFSMAEDAMSNVPKTLYSASLALGATPWQTVWTVILPAAVPGIIAGMILGFGRAVGETMIVLMATGNTPILDMSIFNGFRALSANIAVEIPEAPHGGTLYRILFLSALMLLVFTSILNTISEMIRQRLRKYYSKY